MSVKAICGWLESSDLCKFCGRKKRGKSMMFEEFVWRWEQRQEINLQGHLGCCAYVLVSAQSLYYAEIVQEAREAGFGVEEVPPRMRSDLQVGGAVIEEFA